MKLLLALVMSLTAFSVMASHKQVPSPEGYADVCEWWVDVRGSATRDLRAGVDPEVVYYEMYERVKKEEPLLVPAITTHMRELFQSERTEAQEREFTRKDCQAEFGH